MTVFRAVLALHIAAGAAGLILGPIAMCADHRVGDLRGQDREAAEAIAGGSLSVQGAAASKAAAARSTAASWRRRPTI